MPELTWAAEQATTTFPPQIRRNRPRRIRPQRNERRSHRLVAADQFGAYTYECPHQQDVDGDLERDQRYAADVQFGSAAAGSCCNALRRISVDLGTSRNFGSRPEDILSTREYAVWPMNEPHRPVTRSHDRVGYAAKHRPGRTGQRMRAHHDHIRVSFRRDGVDCWCNVTAESPGIDSRS